MGKSVYEVAEQGLGWVGDSTWFMGKGIEFIGKVEEAWIPSSVFGSDTRSALRWLRRWWWHCGRSYRWWPT